MTPIEQLAKEFSKGNPATEAAFLAGAKQARLQDIDALKFIPDQNDDFNLGVIEAIKTIEELL